MRVNGRSNYKQPGQHWVPKLVYIYEWRALFYRVKGINQEKEVLLILILIKTPGGNQPSLQNGHFIEIQHLLGPIQGTVH